MHRPAATIVVLAWNEWAATRACLDSLRPTLRPTDEVVVVDNGSTDQTPRGLDRYPWIRRIANAENRGFAAGCNQGAATATNDVVVFLNNDTVPVGRWLDALLEPFADESIGATGSRSNAVSGSQLVHPVGYDHTPGAVPKRADLSRFEREWNRTHRGQVRDVDRLVGFCLAVRRGAFEAVGGFDESFGLGGFEDDDLCLRLLAAGHRLVVAEASFVHHHGHRTFDANDVDRAALERENLDRFRRKHGGGVAVVTTDNEPATISACLIVRDEEEHLAECLQALDGVVDEIVVHDTGSSDSTVAIARAAGAVVIEGEWHDDFARARNVALDACTGTWILHVDADERLVVEADLAAELRSATVDAFRLVIDNVDDDGSVMYAHDAVRLFRRRRGRWSGRIHEQVVTTDGGPALTIDATSCARIVHGGYAPSALARGGKLERNVSIGRRAVEEEGGRADGRSLLNLARALRAAGNGPEAMTNLEAALARTLGPIDRRLALSTGAALLLELGRPADALAWLDELRAAGDDSSMTVLLAGLAHAALDDVDTAMTMVLPLEQVDDGAGYVVPPARLLTHQGEVCARARRWDEAARRLCAAAALDPSAVPWALLATACAEADHDVRDAVASVPDQLVLSVVAQLDDARPAGAHAVLDALWARFDGDRRILAGAVRLAPRFTPGQAMEWSARLRAVGLEGSCPLVAIAADARRDGLDRVRALALLAGAFDGRRAHELLPDVAASTTVADFSDAIVDLDAIAPALLARYVELLASTPRRCRALSTVLADLGAVEEAAIVADLGRAMEPAADGSSATADVTTGAGVVVLGMHRSGTSAVTRALSLLGLRTAGEHDLMPPAAHNERGFWESSSLSSLNDHVLEAFGGSWSCPPELEPGWADGALAAALHPAAAATFARAHGPDDGWVWKDPRTCLTFSFWTHVFTTPPVVVLPYRNPLEVWRSLERRDGLAKAHSLALWERHVRAALLAADGRPTLVTGYDRLLDDPDGWADGAAGFLTRHGLDADAAPAIAPLRAFLEPSLRHARVAEEMLADDPDVTDAQRALWQRLRELDGAHDALDAGTLPPEDGSVAAILDQARGRAADPSPQPLVRVEGNRPRCSIVIPLFDRVDFTRRCLESLAATTDGRLFELVLVDNGCTDGTEALLARLEGDVVIVRNDRNLGFACASNQGARVARGEHLLFLNNDTEARPGWLPPLLDVLDQRPEVGAVGARLLYPDGRIQHAGVHVGADRRPGHVPIAPFHRNHRAEADAADVLVPGPMSALTGACLLVRRDAFTAAGGFDEAYWNGYEDMELCFRVREDGWTLWYEPRSCLVHHESVSGTERFSAEDRNVALLVDRWSGQVPADVTVDETGRSHDDPSAATRPIRRTAGATTR